VFEKTNFVKTRRVKGENGQRTNSLTEINSAKRSALLSESCQFVYYAARVAVPQIVLLHVRYTQLAGFRYHDNFRI